MEDGLSEKAIKAALCGNWEEAIRVNRQILTENPKDANALNRLGRAYLESGDIRKAKETIETVLKKIDPYNQIALKNLDRLKTSGKPKKHRPISQALSDNKAGGSFIEEPGKTKTVTLVNLAPPKILCTLFCGQNVSLRAKHHGIHVYDNGSVYLGSFPDDVGRRLNTLVHGGNNYEGFIKARQNGCLTVFVREIARSKKYTNIPSFYSTGVDHPNITTPGESEQAETAPASPKPSTDDDEESMPPAIASIHQDEESEESA